MRSHSRKKAHYCIAHSLDLCAKCSLEISEVKDLMSGLNMYINMGNSSLILSRLTEAVPGIKASNLNFVITRWNTYLEACLTVFPHSDLIKAWVLSEQEQNQNNKSLKTMSELLNPNTRIQLDFLIIILGLAPLLTIPLYCSNKFWLII